MEPVSLAPCPAIATAAALISFPQVAAYTAVCKTGGREGGREGGRVGGREGGREGDIVKPLSLIELSQHVHILTSFQDI